MMTRAVHTSIQVTSPLSGVGAGGEQDDGAVCERHDVDLGLAHAHGLDQHDVASGRVQYPQSLRRGPGQPAEMAAGGHGADEDAVVRGVLAHADAIAEEGAPGEG